MKKVEQLWDLPYPFKLLLQKDSYIHQLSITDRYSLFGLQPGYYFVPMADVKYYTRHIKTRLNYSSFRNIVDYHHTYGFLVINRNGVDYIGLDKQKALPWLRLIKKLRKKRNALVMKNPELTDNFIHEQKKN